MISEQRIIELAKEAGLHTDGKRIRVFPSQYCSVSNCDISETIKDFANSLQAEWIKSLGEPYAYVTDELGNFVLNHYIKLVNGFPPLDNPDTKWIQLYALPNEEVK